MMDAALMPYDCRTPATAHIPRAKLTQHFLPGSFTQAPVSSLPSPASPQHHAPASYNHGYAPYGQPPMLDAPFRSQERLERVQPRVLPADLRADKVQESVDASGFVKRSRSPSIKSKAKSPTSDSPSPKIASPSERAQGAPIPQFTTPIDKLAKVIEEKGEILGVLDEAKSGKAGEKKERTQQSRDKAKRGRFSCDIDGCTKWFKQKNHLESHQRSHTGESPYACPFCPRRFTQSVNLTSHINRHLGTKPYKCEQCPKRFSQPSNVKAHMSTHLRRELRAHWLCRFGNCEKAFTAKGNLKNHQNACHEEEIEAFKAKLASTVDESTISEEEREMARYILDVHNLANKGIKGRGKGRKVEPVNLAHPLQPEPQHHLSPAWSPTAIVHTAGPFPMSLPTHGLPNLHDTSPHHHLQRPTAAYHSQHYQAFYGLSNPAAHIMAPPSANIVSSGPLTNNTQDAYSYSASGMLDSDQLSDVMELTFGERLF